jgi:hypothetical protein
MDEKLSPYGGGFFLCIRVYLNQSVEGVEVAFGC